MNSQIYNPQVGGSRIQNCRGQSVSCLRLAYLGVGLLGVLVLTWQALAKILRLVLLREESAVLGGGYYLSAQIEKNCRFALIFLTIALLNCSIVYRLFTLQGSESSVWKNYASRQHNTKVTVSGTRGSVVDRVGRPLAVSIPSIAVAIRPHLFENNPENLSRLAALLDLSENDISEKLSTPGKFKWLKRGLVGERRRVLERAVPAGVEIFSEFTREYPQGELASTLIGRVGRDGDGQNGLEAHLNPSLSAEKFSHSVARDARGRLVNHLGLSKISLDNDAQARSEGNGVTLTIDSFIQRIVETELAEGVAKAKATAGVAVLMDAETGEILSLAQHRGENSNLEGMELFRNIAVQNNFEPGSTIKPLIAAAALDRGLIGRDEVFDCGTGRVSFGSYSIGDVHPIGRVPLEQVLVQSSNVCMAKIANRLGAKDLYEYLTSLGFGSGTGLPVIGEAKGILRNYKSWRPISIATHGFGQGMAVTALQLTKAYASLVNGGNVVSPSLILDPAREREPKTRVFSEETAHTILHMLAGVTEDAHGTGRAAKIEGLTVYGKTGTAQQPRRNGRGYDPDRVLASFVGAVDGRDIGLERKLVMFVAIDEPGVKPRWGGRLAGPVFKRSMERVLSYLLSSSGSALRASTTGYINPRV